MFERFTGRARNAVMLAREEARGLHHNYIGTEHILLGLIREQEGLAARALTSLGISLDSVRQEVVRAVGTGQQRPVEGHVPFTPRAKKVLELALREALALHHNYIGTEHILLGLIREGEGVAAQVLRKLGADLPDTRQRVIQLLGEYTASRSAMSGRRRWWQRWLPSLPGMPGMVDPDEPRTTPAAEKVLVEARRLAGLGPLGSHHLALAALNLPETAAAKAIGGLGIDLDRAREGLSTVDTTGTTDELPEETGRRQMTVRLTEDNLVIETRDPTLLAAARRAVDSLGSQLVQPGVVPGDLPASAGLWRVWQALLGSLQEMSEQPGRSGDPGSGNEPIAG